MHSVLPVIVGSNTAVSRQTFVSFPSSDSNNEVRGFASMDQGFGLENSLTNCIFNAFFPVAGNIVLNSGTLTLKRDLELYNATLVGGGIIEANAYTMHFTSTKTVSFSQTNAKLTLLDQKTLSGSLNSVSWSTASGYIATGGADNALTVFSFDGSALTQLDSQSAGGIAYSIRWHPTQYYIALGRSNGTGNEFQIWFFNTGTNALSQTDGISFGSSATVPAVAWHPTGNYVVSGNDKLTEINLYSFSAGTLTPVTTFNYSGNDTISQNALDFKKTGTYLAVGKQLNNTLSVLAFNGSTLVENASAAPGVTVYSVSWHPTLPLIAVGLAATTETIRIYEHNSGAGTLTERTTARVGATNDILSVNWSADGKYLTIGRIATTGTEFRVYSFDSTAYTLTLEVGLESVADVTDVRWSRSGLYIARSDLNNNVSVYSFSPSAGTLGYIFNNVRLSFHTHSACNTTWQFNGTNNSVTGRGHTFNFQGGNIIVGTGSSLLLEDMTIKGIAGTNVSCQDNLSTVSLRNVVWLQDSDFTFTKGHIDIVGDVIISGTNYFNYQTDQVSTIESDATLFFDAGMKFRYQPASASSNLLAMAAKSSILHLYEAELRTTTTAFQLTKGTMVFEGTCPIINTGTVESQGIMFGDGASAANDLRIKILPESGLNIQQGFLVYKNIN